MSYENLGTNLCPECKKNQKRLDLVVCTRCELSHIQQMPKPELEWVGQKASITCKAHSSKQCPKCMVSFMILHAKKHYKEGEVRPWSK